MVNNFNNINRTNNYLSPQIIELKEGPWHMALEIQVPAWDMHINVSGLNRLIGSQPSSLDNAWNFLLKGEFAVGTTDKICGQSLS